MAHLDKGTQAAKRDPVLYLLYKNLFLIILAGILVAGIGFGLGRLRVKPVYTASKTVILRASVDNVSSSSQDAKNKNDVSLAKRLLPNVAKDITNQRVEEYANEYYTGKGGNGRISRGNVKTSYDTDSFVFVISYSDTDESVVNEKLDAVIGGFNNYLDIDNADYEVIMAKDLRLVNLQNRESEPSKTYNITMYVVLGAVIGVALAIAFVFLRYSLDNTVKSKEDFERLTDVTVLSYISKSPKTDNKKKGKR